MTQSTRSRRLLPWLGVTLLQLVMTQVFTFLASFLVPDIEAFQKSHPALFAAMLGAAFTIGVFLVGFLALRQRWLIARPMYPARLASVLVGAYLPLCVALVLYRTLEPGNPFFLVSTIAAVLGFHVPDWVTSRKAP